jgi:two-component system phosphate regulon sensor histidine kinase PhoR
MSSENILLILTDPQLEKLLKDGTLTPSGYKVSCVGGINAARAALTTLIDLMIVDEALGFEELLKFTENALREYPYLSIILIGDTEEDHKVLRAMRAGIVDYLSIPLKSSEVLNSVRNGLNRRRQIDYWMRTQTRRDTASLRRHVDELKELEQIGRSVTASLDLDYVLTAIVDAAVKVTGAEEGSLLLIDDNTGELYMRAARNFQDEFVQMFRLPVSDTLAGEVIRTGEPVLLDEETPQKIKTAYLVKTLIYVPLKLHDKVIGILGVDNRESKQSFTKDHVMLTSALADYAVIAVENARLYNETELERQKYETILTQIEDGVIVVGLDNRIILANRIARDMFDLWGQDIETKTINWIIQLEPLLELFEKQGDKDSHRVELLMEDGRGFNAQLVEIPEVGYAITIQDITYFKELDRIKSDFVNTVSHDLRSPLTAILGYVELIGRVGEVNDQQREFINRVQLSVRNITTLINDLLELGRIETGLDARKEFIPLSVIVQYAVDSMQNSLDDKEHQLILDFADNLPKVYGDPARLRQMVDQLLSNAVIYMPKGGQIIVRLRSEKDQVILQIEDSGVGILPADQPYIFDKFYRASNVPPDSTGTGLGLAIVKSIVDNHRGRVWVDSMTGKGSTFTVVLPIADDVL